MHKSKIRVPSVGTKVDSSTNADITTSSHTIGNTMLPAVVSSKLRPILFSTEMVMAILEGRKTQTRRIIKSKSPIKSFEGILNDKTFWKNEIIGNYLFDLEEGELSTKPYSNIGDVLWVRETFAETCDEYGTPIIAYKVGLPRIITASNGKYELWKETNTEWSIDNYPSCGKWKTSLFMPFYACRIFLKVTNIRVEKLQYISEKDAQNEGSKFAPIEHLGNTWKSYKQGFEYLWQDINGKESWEQNPYVWVIEFERCSKP
jgi:hypothetical protein